MQAIGGLDVGIFSHDEVVVEQETAVYGLLVSEKNAYDNQPRSSQRRRCNVDRTMAPE